MWDSRVILWAWSDPILCHFPSCVFISTSAITHISSQWYTGQLFKQCCWATTQMVLCVLIGQSCICLQMVVPMTEWWSPPNKMVAQYQWQCTITTMLRNIAQQHCLKQKICVSSVLLIIHLSCCQWCRQCLKVGSGWPGWCVWSSRIICVLCAPSITSLVPPLRHCLPLLPSLPWKPYACCLCCHGNQEW